MKKIQLFIRELGYSGTEKQVLILANSLSSSYHVEIISLGKSINDNYNLNKKVKLIELNNKIDTNFFNNIKIKSDINKYLKNNKADIVISTDIIFNRILAKKKNKNSLFYWENDLHLDKLELLKKSLIGFDRIILPNDFMRECYGITSIPVSIIPLSIEALPEKVSPLNSKMLVAVGKLRKNKCYNDLLDVMELVHQKNKDITLHIVGDGEERIELSRLVKEKKLEMNVRFYGFLDKDEIKRVLSIASLFVSTSNQESFGVSFIDAMSYGIPCVTYPLVSLKDIIKNDINGYILDKRDKEEMADKILTIIKNKELRENLGNCARETSIIYEINTIKSEWLKIL